jgi:hypothetical protein
MRRPHPHSRNPTAARARVKGNARLYGGTTLKMRRGWVTGDGW